MLCMISLHWGGGDASGDVHGPFSEGGGAVHDIHVLPVNSPEKHFDSRVVCELTSQMKQVSPFLVSGLCEVSTMKRWDLFCPSLQPHSKSSGDPHPPFDGAHFFLALIHDHPMLVLRRNPGPSELLLLTSKSSSGISLPLLTPQNLRCFPSTARLFPNSFPSHATSSADPRRKGASLVYVCLCVSLCKEEMKSLGEFGTQ